MLYLLIKIVSFIFTKIPVKVSLFLARVSGNIFYLLAIKKRRIAFINLKRALLGKYNQRQIKQILKKSFINFSQNIVEALYLQRIDKKYIDKYVRIDGLDYINQALKGKKGAIIAGTHFGSWEISSAACALLGYNYNLIFKQQENQAFNDLLNQYRIDKGSKIYSRGFSIRDIIRSLENNEVVGLAMDQGSLEGSVFVDFFKEPVPIPSGTLRIALKTGAAVIPAYIRRVEGPKHNLVFLPPLDLSGCDENNLEKPLKEFNQIAEDFISRYPENYTWFYKRWKRSPVRNCLILSDQKAGHLSQVKGLLNILKKSKFQIREKFIEVSFKNDFAKNFLAFCAFTSGTYCMGCLSCLRFCLSQGSFKELENSFADIVVSCGSSLASVNIILKNETNAKSITIMKPGVLNPKRFDLVIAPKHDNLSKDSNVVITDLALNNIDQGYLDNQKNILISQFPQLNKLKGPTLAVFLGGPNRRQSMDEALIRSLFTVIKEICEKSGMNLLITTSRRTPAEIQDIAKNEFVKYTNCRLLVIANESNPQGASAGMLALSDLVIISSDSISMVSEAVASGKLVIVFRLNGLKNTKHEVFLNNLEAKNYIMLQDIANVEAYVLALLKNNTLASPAEEISTQEEKILKFLS